MKQFGCISYRNTNNINLTCYAYKENSKSYSVPLIPVNIAVKSHIIPYSRHRPGLVLG